MSLVVTGGEVRALGEVSQLGEERQLRPTAAGRGTHRPMATIFLPLRRKLDMGEKGAEVGGGGRASERKMAVAGHLKPARGRRSSRSPACGLVEPRRVRTSPTAGRVEPNRLHEQSTQRRIATVSCDSPTACSHTTDPLNDACNPARSLKRARRRRHHPWPRPFPRKRRVRRRPRPNRARQNRARP